MKIEKITKSGSKYKLILDTGEIITTYDSVILDYGLLYHKRLDQTLLNKIQNDTEYYEKYNKVVKMINTRLKSIYEIKKYLTKENVGKEYEEKIINNLIKVGLLDDERFAQAYTNDKIHLTSDGPAKIKNNLQKHHIKNEYIENAINNIDPKIIDSHINKIIEKKIKSNTKNTNVILKQKITAYLINQGYEIEDINRNLEKHTFKENDLTSEMDKIYNKLIKKNPQNFNQKLKAKLYSKGFTIEEINNYINKKSSVK